jgi:hypothetical protein
MQQNNQQKYSFSKREYSNSEQRYAITENFIVIQNSDNMLQIIVHDIRNNLKKTMTHEGGISFIQPCDGDTIAICFMKLLYVIHLPSFFKHKNDAIQIPYPSLIADRYECIYHVSKSNMVKCVETEPRNGFEKPTYYFVEKYGVVKIPFEQRARPQQNIEMYSLDDDGTRYIASENELYAYTTNDEIISFITGESDIKRVYSLYKSYAFVKTKQGEYWFMKLHLNGKWSLFLKFNVHDYEQQFSVPASPFVVKGDNIVIISTIGITHIVPGMVKRACRVVPIQRGIIDETRIFEKDDKVIIVDAVNEGNEMIFFYTQINVRSKYPLLFAWVCKSNQIWSRLPVDMKKVIANYLKNYSPLQYKHEIKDDKLVFYK